MATVKAVETVEALKIPAEGFQSFLLSHPAVASRCSGDRGSSPRDRTTDRRVDGQLMRMRHDRGSQCAPMETSEMRGRNGVVWQVSESASTRLRVEPSSASKTTKPPLGGVLQTSLWVQGPIGMAGLRVAPHGKLTERQISRFLSSRQVAALLLYSAENALLRRLLGPQPPSALHRSVPSSGSAAINRRRRRGSRLRHTRGIRSHRAVERGRSDRRASGSETCGARPWLGVVSP
jgi:hypothetical protein